MNIKNIYKSVSTIVQNVDTIIMNYEAYKINLNAVYTRDIVWDTDTKSKFIESCLKGILPNPLIYNYDNDIYICIDGKQRITTLVEFFNNTFPFKHNGIKYYATNALNAQSKVLSKKVYDNLKNTNIPIYVYKNLTYEEEVDIFRRIHYGQVLTEKKELSAKQEPSAIKELIMTHNYIYLLREREFIKTYENIYKIGRTNQCFMARFKQYPKGSKLELILAVTDSITVENILKKALTAKFTKRTDIGSEYFQGSIREIKKVVTAICQEYY